LKPKATKHARHKPSNLYSLPQCLEQQAICSYFVHLQPRLLGYITDDLPALYTSAGPTSILSKAASALALSFTALHPHYFHYRPLAISKYGQCLPLVREAVNDPEVVHSNSFLMAVILLDTWEVSHYHELSVSQCINAVQHSRSLALEPSERKSHLQGAIAVIKSRPRQSFTSELSRRLLMHIRAKVVSSRTVQLRLQLTNRSGLRCIGRADPKPIEEILAITDDCMLPAPNEQPQDVYPDFFTLPQIVMCIPQFRARQRSLVEK
jgi:hypothetical protein